MNPLQKFVAKIFKIKTAESLKAVENGSCPKVYFDHGADNVSSVFCVG